MQRADRQSPAVSLGLQDSPHAERIGVAYIVAEVDHRLRVMPIDQSANAVTLVGAHRMGYVLWPQEARKQAPFSLILEKIAPHALP